MNIVELRGTPRCRMLPSRCFPLFASAILMLADPLVAAAQEAAERPLEDVTILPPFSVKGDRMEDLGVRFNGQFGIPTSLTMLSVAEVFPNTAAAKAGLRPGERIEKIDGNRWG
jgi:S1-C subfamily serine protease